MQRLASESRDRSVRRNSKGFDGGGLDEFDGAFRKVGWQFRKRRIVERVCSFELTRRPDAPF